MAILSDFFVASRGEITQGLLHPGPSSHFPVVSTTAFTTLEMAPLLHIIQDGSLDNDEQAVARIDEFESVLTGSIEGPWLNRFPQALCNALAAASENDLTDYANRWIVAEELADMGQETLTSLLRDLASLARLAQAEGKDLYLWFSL